MIIEQSAFKHSPEDSADFLYFLYFDGDSTTNLEKSKTLEKENEESLATQFEKVFGEKRWDENIVSFTQPPSTLIICDIVDNLSEVGNRFSCNPKTYLVH